MDTDFFYSIKPAQLCANLDFCTILMCIRIKMGFLSQACSCVQEKEITHIGYSPHPLWMFLLLVRP